MANLVALFFVLCFVAALMVLAAMWFYVLAALCALYGVMRFVGRSVGVVGAARVSVRPRLHRTPRPHPWRSAPESQGHDLTQHRGSRWPTPSG